MEHIQFENRYSPTEDILRIYSKEILTKRFQKQFWVLVIIFALLMIPGFLIPDYIILALTGSCLVLSLILTLLLPHLMLRRILRTQKQVYGNKLPTTLVQLGDAIRLQEGPCDITIAYNQITEIYLLREIIVLMSGKTNGILMKRGGFTRGAEQEFPAFIRQHCPDARLYQRNTD